MPVSSVKPSKNRFIPFAIITLFLICAFIAACGLRAAQGGGATAEVLNAPPLAPGAERETTLRAGREVVRLMRQRDGAAVFAKFAPMMARSFSLSTVQEGLNSIDLAPNGAPVGEIVAGSDAAPVYYTLLPTQSGKSQQAVAIAFESARGDKISSMSMDTQTKPLHQAETIKAGQVVCALVAKKDVDGLYALFAPNMVERIPKAKIAEVVEQMVTTQKPVGRQIGEVVSPASVDEGSLLYVGEFALGSDNALKILMSFTPDNQKLTSIRFVPGLPAKLARDPHAGYRMKSHLHLPFAPGDKWTIGWGGDTRRQNYHVDYTDQRHAFDILALENNKTHTGDGKTPSQYFAWGRKIVAPADATVSEAVDGLPDNAPGKMDAAHAFGNHVVLDLGNSEYAVFAHLQNGTVKVKKGQTVKAGRILGLCGNSGNTSEPHLHFHVQDGPILSHAKGLPVTFWDYVSNGKPVKSGSPVQKEVVEIRP